MIRVAEGVSDRALGATLRLAGTILGARPRRTQPIARGGTGNKPQPPQPGPGARPQSPPSRVPHGNGAGELASERLEREGLTATLPGTTPETGPPHISDEPELVLETAEPGAEEGAGASVSVREPWEGYAHMNARSVISRLAQATKVELTAVALYERAHRGRRTVLDAVERGLRAPGR